MECYSAIKKEWSRDSYNSMDKPWKHYAKCKKPVTKDHVLFNSIHIKHPELENLFWTVVLEKALESPLDCKEIQPVHSEGDQPWDFFGRNDAKAETPVLWPPHVKSWLTGKDSDAGRDWGQEEKVMTEDEMAGWHHWLDGRESEWTLGVGDGQGGLACCNSWGCKESDMTERLNWSELMLYLKVTKRIDPKSPHHK